MTDVDQQISASSVLKGLKILLVDDNQNDRIYFSTLLKKLGLTVTSAESGHNAIALLKQAIESHAKFDIVMIDYIMPDLSGIDVSKTISELAETSLPIIFSSSTEKLNATELASIGVAGLIDKTDSIENFQKILEKAWNCNAVHRDYQFITRNEI